MNLAERFRLSSREMASRSSILKASHGLIHHPVCRHHHNHPIKVPLRPFDPAHHYFPIWLEGHLYLFTPCPFAKNHQPTSWTKRSKVATRASRRAAGKSREREARWARQGTAGGPFKIHRTCPAVRCMTYVTSRRPVVAASLGGIGSSGTSRLPF